MICGENFCLVVTLSAISIIMSKVMLKWSCMLSRENEKYIEPFIKVSGDISKKYILLTVACLFPLMTGAMMYQQGGGDFGAGLCAYIFTAFLVQFILTDLFWQLIFDKQLLLLALLGLIRLLLGNYILWDHILAAVLGGSVFLLLAVLTRGGIGGGDIKLLAVLGLWLGQALLFKTATAGIILGGLGAIIILIGKKRRHKEFFPYGPYFAVSALAYYLLG